jgi:Holliday junction resolvasome RuvABC endonuclease subunit
MNILAIDPGESCGYALINLDGTHADIYEYGFLEVDKSSEYQGDHCLDLMQQLTDIIKRENIESVCVEDYFFSQKFANGCNVNAAYRTASHILFRQLKLHYEILNISLWKK